MSEHKPDLKDIENEQKAIQLLAQEVQKANDADERDAMIEEIKRMADRLQKMCEAMKDEADKVVVPKLDNLDIEAVVEVILTPDQRRHVMDEYGVDVPSIRIPDPTGVLTKNMHNITPSYIEECAMKQAKAFKKMVAEAERLAADAEPSK